MYTTYDANFFCSWNRTENQGVLKMQNFQCKKKRIKWKAKCQRWQKHDLQLQEKTTLRSKIIKKELPKQNCCFSNVFYWDKMLNVVDVGSLERLFFLSAKTWFYIVESLSSNIHIYSSKYESVCSRSKSTSDPKNVEEEN
jgi:hypothetical protein